MWRVFVSLVACLMTACAAPPVSPPPVATSPPTPAPTTITPTAVPTSTPRPALAPSPVPTPAAALPTVATSAPSLGPGFLTPVELELEFQQPLTTQDDLRQLVDGVQQLNGIAAVESNGVRIRVRYDSTRVLPARIRDRLRELGHPARAGTDVQNPGDAAD